MKHKSYLTKTKNLGVYIAHETWAGPGKFAIVIFIGYLIVGVHENYFMQRQHLSNVEQ
jgi:hypothetical protein